MASLREQLKKITVSGRASQLLKEDSSRTWSEAMRIAYKEIARPVIEKDKKIKERAKKLKSLNPRLTDEEAKQQAYEDVVAPDEKIQEDNAKKDFNSFIKTLRGQSGPEFFLDLNDLVADVLEDAVDSLTDDGEEYPYTAMKKVMDMLPEIQSLVNKLEFTYTNRDTWESEFRMADGKISTEWKDDAESLADKLGVDIEKSTGYDIVNNYFK